EQPYAELFRAHLEPFLALGALCAAIGEAVAEDGRDRHAAAAAVLESALDVFDHDERVLDRMGNRSYVRVGLLSENFFPPRIHRKDIARKAMLAQEALRTGSRLRRIARGADERDRARCEQNLSQAHRLAHAARVFSVSSFQRRPSSARAFA